MSDQPELDEVVDRYLRAERALTEVQVQHEELRRAVGLFVDAEATLSERTTGALDALEEARARLRDQVQSTEAITQGTVDLHATVTRLIAEVSLVLQTLHRIDPAAMTRDLAELRRMGADNAAEVREVRRLLADLERTQGLLAVGQAAMSTVNNEVAGRLKSLVPVIWASAVLSLAATVVALVR